MSSTCRHKYKLKNKTCPNPTVKSDILCRRHRYSIKKNPEKYNILKSNGRIKKAEEPVQEEDTKEDSNSLCSIQESEEEISDTPTANNDKNDELINISRHFVFDCIDKYFERHHRRNEYLNNMKSSNRKSGGGMDLSAIMGIAGVSLAPFIGQYIKKNMPTNNNINNNGNHDKSEFIAMDRAKRADPKDDKNFINTDNTEETKFHKM